MGQNATYGALAYDLGHCLGGAVLVLSFALLSQRRVSVLISLYAVQASVLALDAAWQAYLQSSAELLVGAFVTFGVKAIAIPAALRRMMHDLALRRGVESAMGVFPSMALGVALTALAILAVLPVTLQTAALTREDVALALSVVLLGMLMMLSRNSALAQVIGFLSLENGLVLAAIGVSGMPLVVELSVAVLVLVAFGVFGMLVFRIRGHFGTLDTAHLDRVLRGRE